MTNPIKSAKTLKRLVNPKKLLHSKWTAVTPTDKEKHFMVIKLVLPDIPTTPVVHIMLEAVHSKRCQLLPWQQLNDESIWLQGWQ